MTFKEFKEVIVKIWKLACVFPKSTAGFIKKDFALLFRKKKYLYLSALLPLIVALIYAFTLIGDGSEMEVIVCDLDGTRLTEEVMSSLDFSVYSTNGDGCEDWLIESIKNRDYLFGIVIDEGFTQNLDGLRPAEVRLFFDNSDPSIASLAAWKIDYALEPYKDELVMELGTELKQNSAKARDKTQTALDVLDIPQYSGLSSLRRSIEDADSNLEKLERLEPGFLASPIRVHQQGVHPEFRLIDVGIAPLYSVLSLFIILMLCSTGAIYDRKMRLIERIRASNTTMTSYVLSKMIFFFAITIVQFIIILLLFLVFGANYDISILMLIKALLFITLVNTLLGLLIGIISDSEGIAVLISLIITLPVLFLSGMFYPIELMPKFIQWMAKILPMQTEVMMMKQAMLFGGDVSSWYFLAPIALFGLCLYLLRR